MILWAMTTMGYEAPNFIDQLSRNPNSFYFDKKGIIPSNLSALAVSLAMQGRWEESAPILDALSKNVVRRNGVLDDLIENVKFRGNKSRKSATYNFQSTLHDVIGIAWGLTIASPGIAEEEGAQRLEAVMELRQFALENYPQNSWNVKDATQLRQLESFLLMEGIDIGERLTNFKTFTNEVYADQRESGFERFVSEALNEIGFQHEREVYPFPSTLGWKTGDKKSFAIDIANREKRIAIEVDGPFHFLSNVNEKHRNTGRPSGTTMAKKRLLESLGWRTFNYSYLEHRDIIKHVAEGVADTTNEIAVQEYWKNRLQRAGVLLGLPQRNSGGMGGS